MSNSADSARPIDESRSSTDPDALPYAWEGDDDHGGVAAVLEGVPLSTLDSPGRDFSW
jgi:hypothetical protein